MEYKSIIEMNNHELLGFMIAFCKEYCNKLDKVTTGNLSHTLVHLKHVLRSSVESVEKTMKKNDGQQSIIKLPSIGETKYKLVKWPESQLLMEHPRFHECLFVDNIEGHDDVGGSAYMCPIDLYEELYKIKSNEVEPPSFEESMGEFNDYHVALNG